MIEKIISEKKIYSLNQLQDELKLVGIEIDKQTLRDYNSRHNFIDKKKIIEDIKVKYDTLEGKMIRRIIRDETGYSFNTIKKYVL